MYVLCFKSCFVHSAVEWEYFLKTFIWSINRALICVTIQVSINLRGKAIKRYSTLPIYPELVLYYLMQFISVTVLSLSRRYNQRILSLADLTGNWFWHKITQQGLTCIPIKQATRLQNITTDIIGHCTNLISFTANIFFDLWAYSFHCCQIP